MEEIKIRLADVKRVKELLEGCLQLAALQEEKLSAVIKLPVNDYTTLVIQAGDLHQAIDTGARLAKNQGFHEPLSHKATRRRKAWTELTDMAYSTGRIFIKDIADCLGVMPTVIGKYQQGTKVPRNGTLVRLNKFISQTVDTSAVVEQYPEIFHPQVVVTAQE